MKYLVLAGMFISFYSNNFGMDTSELIQRKRNKITIKNDTLFDLTIITHMQERFNLKPGKSHNIDCNTHPIKGCLQVDAEPRSDQQPRTLHATFSSTSKHISIVEAETDLIDCVCCLCMLCCCKEELTEPRLMLWETNENN